MKYSLKEKLRGDAPLLGIILSLPSPELAELVSAAGYDWVFIDGEHSTLGFRDIQIMLQSLSPSCSGVVRVPLLDEIWIKKVLDMGAEGIIVPQVQTAEEARRVVELCTYPPRGTRSVGVARANNYGLSFGEYVREANNRHVIILQLEHVKAFSNIDSILEVEGYDAIFIGPYDYSASAGKTGKVDDPEIQEQIARVREKCFRKKIPMGIFGINAAAVKPYICQGYTLIACGTDTWLFKDAVLDCLDMLRRKGQK